MPRNKTRTQHTTTPFSITPDDLMQAPDVYTPLQDIKEGREAHIKQGKHTPHPEPAPKDPELPTEGHTTYI